MKKAVIEWEGGSKFQEYAMTEGLRAALMAFQSFYLGKHKKNRIEITYKS